MPNRLPAACPECGLSIPEAKRAGHLVAAHGYVDLWGTLLPRDRALRQLWERVFATGDVAAHDRLGDLLLPAADGTTDPRPYRAALEAEIARRGDEVVPGRGQAAARLLSCLRQSPAARAALGPLLESGNPLVRELAQEIALPDVARGLAGGEPSAKEVRAALDRLCPGDDAWEKIRFCQRLVNFDVPRPALKECLRQLQNERPVGCPECGQAVPLVQLDMHLRRAHGVYRFRALQGAPDEIVATLLAAVCGPRPDHAAWEGLESLARDEHGDGADAFLVGRLSQTLEGLPKERRPPALAGAAQVLADGDAGPRLLPRLAAAPAPTGRQLALALAARLPAPLDGARVDAVRPLLGDKRLPREARLTAAAALLRSIGPDGPAARAVLEELIAHTGKARAVERLRQLQAKVGSSGAIDELCARLEPQIRMRCPRCRVQLRRPDMARHVWEVHGLMLHGRRVREPWRVVEEMLADYHAGQDAGVLERCRALAQNLDPDHGLQRVARLFLVHGIDDAAARAALLGDARRRRASVCPRCFALVPPPVEAAPRGLTVSHGRLAGDGYAVEVSSKGWISGLEIDRPGGVTHQVEPGRWFTYRGAVLFLAGPPVVVALMLDLVLPVVGVDPLPSVLLFLWFALVGYVVACLGWGAERNVVDRAVDHAWRVLAPRLHADGFSVADSAFLADLALTSVGRGRPEARAAARERSLNLVEDAVADGAAPVSHLAALKRLAVEDAAAAGHDPVRLVVAQVGRCFDGELPLLYAERLLTDWESGWWTDGNLARLRVLLCDRAFEAGLEVRDLIAAGEAAPALGAVLFVEDLDALAQLRLLWSLRPTRPWDRWGEATTVFEIAADPAAGQAVLQAYPDVLLVEQATPPAILCSRGVIFFDTLFPERPAGVELRARPFHDVDGYELVIGEYRFRFPYDPGELIGRLDRWFGYFFDHFLPRVPEVYTWKSPGPGKVVRLHDMISCPECKTRFLPRLGELGIRVDEAWHGPKAVEPAGSV